MRASTLEARDGLGMVGRDTHTHYLSELEGPRRRGLDERAPRAWRAVGGSTSSFTGPWHSSHPQRGQGARPGQLQPVPRRLWYAWGSWRDPLNGPRDTVPEAARGTWPRSCPARCGRWQALSTHATRAGQSPRVARSGRHARAATWNRRNRPTGRSHGRPSGYRWRRNDGILAA